MSTSSYNNISSATAARIVSLYSAGVSIASIAAAHKKSHATVRAFLGASGYLLTTEQRRSIRELLRSGISVEQASSKAGVPMEAVKSVWNRMQKLREKQRNCHDDVILLAKQGYSCARIAALTGADLQVVRRTLRGLDLYADKIASVAQMFDNGMTIEVIVEELGISENRVRGMLREAGKIAGPKKPLRGFQNPNNYQYRSDHRSNK